ncbi:hypothetical protein KUCAC02_033966, partial [Chaenocephalus aceratus]
SWKCLWSGESLKRQERRRVRTRRSHKEKKKKKPADGRRGASFCFQRLKLNLELSGGAPSRKGLFYKITEEVETQAAPLFDYNTGYVWLSLLRRWKSIGSHFYPTCPTQRSRIRNVG